MGDVINLNQYRKQRARDEKARQAKANRARSGRTAGEKSAQSHDTEKSASDLERKRLRPPAKGGTRGKPDSGQEPPEGSTPSAG